MESESGREELTLRQNSKRQNSNEEEPPVMRHSIHSLAFSIQVPDDQMTTEEVSKIIPSARGAKSFLINPSKSKSPKKSLSPSRSPMKRLPSQTHCHPIEVF